MDELKKTVAKNITALRTAQHMTQFELGEMINYSDKAISRWERGEAVPDAYVLLQLAGIFGVTVDYLLSSHDGDESIVTGGEPEISIAESQEKDTEIKYDYVTITLISFIGVWTAALLVFIIFSLFDRLEWIVFVYTLPVSLIVLLVFNSIWGTRRRNFYIISAFNWSVIASIYISFLLFLQYNWWMFFLLGIPAQLITYLCFNIKKSK